MWWQQSEAVGRRRDRNGGPARLGKAKAVRTLARQAGRPVQQAGSGVEARSAQGQGSGAEEDRTRLLQAPRAEHANSRTAVCRGSMYVVRWVRCETGLFVRGTCAIWQWRRDKAGLPVCHSEVSASRLAGARVADAGVGRPEARGLRRAPSIGHSRLRAWRERRARSAKGMRARCGGHWPSSRAVALSRMSGVIRRRRFPRCCRVRWAHRWRVQEAGVAEPREFRVPRARVHFCEGVWVRPGLWSAACCPLGRFEILNLES